MEGFIFLLTIIGVGIVILWTRQNDKVQLEGETSGLLAMTNETINTKTAPSPGRSP